MELENFQPARLMELFCEISKIPRASYNERKIADYIVKFAEKRGFDTYRDDFNNVLVNVPASRGYENRAPLLFQGHTDMVCEKNQGVKHDFSTDSLDLYSENGWLHARGTTLGADDGVAVALMLYFIDGGMEPHPACQCLFTASEEVGLNGATNFDYRRLYARTMLNFDSAEENNIVVGCAGAVRSKVTFTPEFTDTVGNFLEISIDGLCGGHSGEDIAERRANAIKLMGRILLTLDARGIQYSLCSVCGGTKTNAIPREAHAVICTADAAAARSELSLISREISDELSAEDSGFALSVHNADRCRAIAEKDKKAVLAYIDAISNGVLEMSKDVPSVVGFSRNLGVIETDEKTICLLFSSRSAIDSQLDISQRSIDTLAEICGGATKHYNRYPGWDCAEKSIIAERYSHEYEKLFGKRPQMNIIHAGLECGVIKGAIPDMDIISCGPDARGLHSPEEKLSLDSFERVYKVVCAVVRT